MQEGLLLKGGHQVHIYDLESSSLVNMEKSFSLETVTLTITTMGRAVRIFFGHYQWPKILNY